MHFVSAHTESFGLVQSAHTESFGLVQSAVRTQIRLGWRIRNEGGDRKRRAEEQQEAGRTKEVKGGGIGWWVKRAVQDRREEGRSSKLQGRREGNYKCNYAVGIPEPPPHTQIPSKRSHRPIA